MPQNNLPSNPINMKPIKLGMGPMLKSSGRQVAQQHPGQVSSAGMQYAQQRANMRRNPALPPPSNEELRQQYLDQRKPAPPPYYGDQQCQFPPAPLKRCYCTPAPWSSSDGSKYQKLIFGYGMSTNC